MKPEGARPFTLIAVLALVAAALFLIGRRGGPPGSASPDSTTGVIDRDDDGMADGLALKRLAGRPGGSLAIEAISAAGGWDAWSRKRGVSYHLDGVIFDENGAIRERRSEEHLLALGGPPRVRIEADQGGAVMAFGAGGAWGALRKGDGWDTTAGPGGLPTQMVKELTLGVWWTFCLPFDLGDAEAALSLPADTTGAPGDSLHRVELNYAGVPGESEGSHYQLGFDPILGHIIEVRYVSADEPYVLRLDGYREFDGIWRPVRRTLSRIDSATGTEKPVYVQVISDVKWVPAPPASQFEPPQ